MRWPDFTSRHWGQWANLNNRPAGSHSSVANINIMHCLAQNVDIVMTTWYCVIGYRGIIPIRRYRVFSNECVNIVICCALIIFFKSELKNGSISLNVIYKPNLNYFYTERIFCSITVDVYLSSSFIAWHELLRLLFTCLVYYAFFELKPEKGQQFIVMHDCVIQMFVVLLNCSFHKYLNCCSSFSFLWSRNNSIWKNFGNFNLII